MRSLLPQIIKELDITKPRSDFEFETFFLGQFPTPARQMMGVMEEIIRVSAELAVLQNISVEDYEELEKQRKLQEQEQAQNVENGQSQNTNVSSIPVLLK